MSNLPSLEQISQRLSNHSVFLILAESLMKWQAPNTDEGKEMLHQHYLWILSLEQQGKLVLGGPIDHDLILHGHLSPIGNITGLIMIKAETREEAVSIAGQDPFHTSGYRKNMVHALNIRFGTVNELLNKPAVWPI